MQHMYMNTAYASMQQLVYYYVTPHIIYNVLDTKLWDAERDQFYFWIIYSCSVLKIFSMLNLYIHLFINPTYN